MKKRNGKNPLLKKQSRVYEILYVIALIVTQIIFDDNQKSSILVAITLTGIAILTAIQDAVSLIADNLENTHIVEMMTTAELIKKGVLQINQDADVSSISDLYQILDDSFDSLYVANQNRKKTK